MCTPVGHRPGVTDDLPTTAGIVSEERITRGMAPTYWLFDFARDAGGHAALRAAL